MALEITIKIKDEGIKTTLAQISERTHNLTPVMKIIAQIVRTSIVKNFESGGRPVAWKPSQRVLKSGGQTLRKSGQLMNSLTAKATSSQAIVGTNKIYAAIQNFGGVTKPHEIRPSAKKALFWPGAKHPVKKIMHPGSKIPARPFMMVQDEDWAEMIKAAEEYLLKQ